MTWSRGRSIVRFTLAPVEEGQARAILTWRYEPPYSFYNADPTDVEGALQVLLDPANAYHAAGDERGELVGFFCFGPDARVPGGDYGDDDALDIGLALRPDLTGQGLGLAFLLAGLDFARQTFAPPRFRLTVATFNRRAIRVYERAGFRPGRTFRREAGGREYEFLQMTGAA